MSGLSPIPTPWYGIGLRMGYCDEDQPVPCTLVLQSKEKREQCFNEESEEERDRREGGGKKEEGGKRRERRKENEKERRGERRRREREGSSNLSISDQLQGGVLVDTKRVRAEVSCNKHRHTRQSHSSL